MRATVAATFAAAMVLAALNTSSEAGTAARDLPVIIHGKLIVVVNPTSASISCDAPAGTVLAAISVTGGDGKPVTLAASGDTTDFALSATTLPANVIVAPGGIVSTGSSCATIPTAGATDVFTVTASQN